MLGFLGPNGAGKSTTMKMVAGFLAPTAGSATVAGFDIEKQPLEAKRVLGYLPEGAPSYGEMTVREFIDFIADVRGLKDDLRYRRIDDAVGRLHLEKVLEQPIDTLSKGFKRRVGLAGAIMASFFYIYPDVGASFALIAYVVVALGGFGSVFGAFAGGILVGLVEATTALVMPSKCVTTVPVPGEPYFHESPPLRALKKNSPASLPGALGGATSISGAVPTSDSGWMSFSGSNGVAAFRIFAIVMLPLIRKPMVWLSVACTTSAAATLPPAPGLFSTITC